MVTGTLFGAWTKGVTALVSLTEASMIWIIHNSLSLLDGFLLFSQLYLVHLFNLLPQLVVLSHQGRVGLVTLACFLPIDKELGNDLIECLIVRLQLWGFLVLDQLTPVKLLEFITNAGLSNDTLQDLDALSQIYILIRKMEAFVFSSVCLLRNFIDVLSELPVRAHEFLGEVDTLDDPVAQCTCVQSVEHGRGT